MIRCRPEAVDGRRLAGIGAAWSAADVLKRLVAEGVHPVQLSAVTFVRQSPPCALRLNESCGRESRLLSGLTGWRCSYRLNALRPGLTTAGVTAESASRLDGTIAAEGPDAGLGCAARLQAAVGWSIVAAERFERRAKPRRIVEQLLEPLLDAMGDLFNARHSS